MKDEEGYIEQDAFMLLTDDEIKKVEIEVKKSMIPLIDWDM